MEKQILKTMDANRIKNLEEANRAIEFVTDLLYDNIAHTQENEPYATQSIREMETALRQLSCIEDLVADIDG